MHMMEFHGVINAKCDWDEMNRIHADARKTRDEHCKAMREDAQRMRADAAMASSGHTADSTAPAPPTKTQQQVEHAMQDLMPTGTNNRQPRK